MGIIEGTREVGAQSMGERKVARGLYDFDTDGGAQGDIVLRGDTIPNTGLIVEAFVEVTTVPTSGGAATIALKAESAADINSADGIGSEPWATTGVKRCDALVGADAGVKTSAERNIVATVGSADLTAGVFVVVVEYYETA